MSDGDWVEDGVRSCCVENGGFDWVVRGHAPLQSLEGYPLGVLGWWTLQRGQERALSSYGVKPEA